MEEIPNSKRYAITKTSLPPCCLRIHPLDSTKIFIGTYKLEENGTRHGSLDYYTYTNNTNNTNTNNNNDNKNESNSLKLIQSVPVKDGAILDVKFNPSNPNCLITVQSNGHLIIWNFNPNPHSPSKNLEIIHDIIIDEDTLITSCFFNPNINPSSQLLLTFTNGYSGIFNLISLKMEFYFDTIHNLECWTGCFGGNMGQLSNVVFTGGDDSQLIAHDLRISPSNNQNIWTLKRGHDAGIVSILCPNKNWNFKNSNQLWTGSYDDNLRIWDLRVIDNGENNSSLIQGYLPKKKFEQNLGGGVWRLIPCPIENDDRLLVCCMYDGARIVNVNNESIAGSRSGSGSGSENEEGFKVERYFKQDHQSMCYGGDWSNDGKYVATCSFYDNIVQIWSPDECI